MGVKIAATPHHIATASAIVGRTAFSRQHGTTGRSAIRHSCGARLARAAGGARAMTSNAYVQPSVIPFHALVESGVKASFSPAAGAAGTDFAGHASTSTFAVHQASQASPAASARETPGRDRA
jgi:hypothetical protein